MQLLKVLKLIFFLIIYIHCLACLFYYVVSVEKEWIPNLDFIYGETELFSKEIEIRYWTSMYHAVLMFGVNEVVPRTTFEIAFVSFVMLVSSMVNANIFGIMAVLVSELNRKSVHF